jgi:type IV secretion system protein TrbG
MIHPVSARISATLIPILLGITACPADAQQPAPSNTSVPANAEPAAAPVPVLHPLPRRAPPVAARRSHASSSPRERVGAANIAARVEPDGPDFFNAIQRYAWEEGALYQVYAKPGQVTDIALQEGEQLVGPGPVAAGDTVRWMIGDTVSGSGASARVHILVKPTRPDITTNVVINTDRRTYHIELRANPSVYMASVSWTYPQDELIALARAQEAAALAAPVAAGLDLGTLNFAYRLSGDRPNWRPVRVFDDGTRVFVEFPETVAQGEMPPLFVLGADDQAELVNYRVSGRYMIVDRLFENAELRLGERRGQQRVRLIAERRVRR